MLFETFTPIWSHVKQQQQNKLQRIQNLKFPNSLNTFGRVPLPAGVGPYA